MAQSVAPARVAPPVLAEASRDASAPVSLWPIAPGSGSPELPRPWAEWEFGGARLADGRQVRSVQAIAAALAETPHRSLTAACGPAARQAAHRIFEHSKTT